MKKIFSLSFLAELFTGAAFAGAIPSTPLGSETGVLCGTTIRFNEYACALDGIVPHGAGAVFADASSDCTAIVIVPPAPIEVPEKGEIPLTPPPSPESPPTCTATPDPLVLKPGQHRTK